MGNTPCFINREENDKLRKMKKWHVVIVQLLLHCLLSFMGSDGDCTNMSYCRDPLQPRVLRAKKITVLGEHICTWLLWLMDGCWPYLSQHIHLESSLHLDDKIIAKKKSKTDRCTAISAVSAHLQKIMKLTRRLKWKTSRREVQSKR